ncbi:MAG: hypothetical protein ACLRL6_17825 [Clostridium sp.]
MSKVVLVAGMCETAPVIAHADYIGVDHGAVCCMRQGIAMRKAVGDFDSITREELAQLKQYCEVEKLPPIKMKPILRLQSKQHCSWAMMTLSYTAAWVDVWIMKWPICI